MLSVHIAGFKIWSHLWGEAEPSLEGLLVGPFMTQGGGEWRGWFSSWQEYGPSQPGSPCSHSSIYQAALDTET